MKKFLTVLLALSVVFTYTVGTAFAVTPDADDSGEYVLTEAEVSKKIEDAYGLALKDLSAEKDAALAKIFAAGKTTAEIKNGADTITVTKAAVEKVYAEIYDAAVEKVEQNKSAALNAVAAAIKDVNDNAAADTSAKTYNGNFQNQTNQGDDAAWTKAGYAKYDADWETKATYLNGAAYEENAYSALFTSSDVGSGDGSGSKMHAVAQEVFKAAKATALTAVQAIDLSVYSKEYNGAAQSNYDLALADKTKAVTAISNLAVADTDVWADVAKKIAAVEDVYTAPINQGAPKGKLYVGGTTTALSAAGAKEEITFKGLDTISKIADEPTEGTKLDWAKNKVLDSILGAINGALKATKDDLNDTILAETLKGANADQKVITKAKEDLAAAEEAAAAAIETVKYLVADCTDYNDLITVAKPFTNSSVKAASWAYDNKSTEKVISDDEIKAAGVDYSMDKFVKVINHIKDLKDEAEVLKNSVAIDGATMVEIDKALEKAIDETYKGDLNAKLNVNTALSIVYSRQTELIGKTGATVKVNNKTYPCVEAWTDNLARDYDKEYYVQVRKVLADTADAIKAAKTVADADAAFVTGSEKLAAVPTKNDKATVQATKEFRDLRDQYAKEITEYAEYKNNLITKSDYSWNKDIMVGKLIEKLDKAYTVDELKAAYTEARAEIDNLKTKATIKAEATELQNKINALPKVATAADKAVVEALRKDVDAHNDYCTLIGDTLNKVTLTSALDNAEKNIKDAEAKAIKDQYDAIMKDGKVTTDEADAGVALRAAYDEFVAYYSDPEEVAIVEPTGVDADKVEKAEKALDAALVKAFNIMVAQLPADGSDVAGIKAARVAYDALSDYAKYGIGAYQGAAYDKLADLEKLLVKNVEALKITASSKAGKGYIKVTWKTKGVATAADGYQVFRSTKRNSGYGIKPYFTTKNKTYKNTKSLKKGKRYYYKVRAYVEIDGQKYYSDWSNKAYRIAK